MNALFSLLHNLNFRIFFFFLIPTTTLLVWLLKFRDLISEDTLNGILSMIFQIFGIYFIGGCWLLLYVIYKVGIAGGSGPLNINSFLASEHLNFDNFQRATFFAWIVGMLNLIFEIY